MKLLTVIAFIMINLSAIGHNGEAFPQQLQIMEAGSVKSVPNAIVYIEELDQEFMTDENGSLNIELEKGHYTLYVSSLGFEEQVIELTVKRSTYKSVLLAESRAVSESNTASIKR